MLAVLALTLPTTMGSTPDLQDDAGSGGDAPDTLDTWIVIQPGVVYEAALPPRIDPADHYAFQGRAGQTVRVTSFGSVFCLFELWTADGQSVTSSCYLGVSQLELRTVLPADGNYVLKASGFAPTYHFAFTLDGPAIDVHFPPASHQVGNDTACGGTGPLSTHGEGPSDLVFAALKTGMRAVVAWRTADAVEASLSYNVSGGATMTLTESGARRDHVFVLDGLPVGETLCFEPGALGPHRLRLANAMNAHDGEAYIINLLVLANEPTDLLRLEEGLDEYAWRLRDATDGHVKSGRIITLVGDLDHHDSGYASCYVPAMLVTVAGSLPTCRGVADVISTIDGYPAGAAATSFDGIQDARDVIWMNSYWQAGALNLGDDIGSVLMHEMGHYAFGALDLYLYVGSQCDVYEKSLSVMSGSRNLTEFDDEINRCPNEAEVPGYVPSWTMMRDRFPLVPDRLGIIDPGPTTPGDAYHRHTYMPLGEVFVVEAAAQADAGSGRDASD